jgi:hypothetical protein
MAISLKQYEHVCNGRFQAGFEIECIIRRNENAEFEKALKNLHKGIQFEYDGSIRPIGWRRSKHQDEHKYYNRAYYKGKMDQAHELLTPVLPIPEALLLLEKIFVLIEKHGYTNKSCGLHCNFSPILPEDYDKINPFYLISQPHWNNLRTNWNRHKNKYCREVGLLQNLDKNPTSFMKHIKHGKFYDKFDGVERHTKEYQHKNSISLFTWLIKLNEFKRLKKEFLKYIWHYSAISFDNYSTERKEDSRIEIRGIGGENYHMRFVEIIECVNESIRLFMQSFEIPIIKKI